MVISKTGAARVCDYGLFSAIPDPNLTETPETVGASRWLAPELIYPPTMPVRVSKSTDVFAFAMLAVEVFSGDIPFGNIRNEAATAQIVRGGRPAKPQAAEQLGLTTEMWKFIEKCWSANPTERPTMDEVVRTWEGFVGECPSKLDRYLLRVSSSMSSSVRLTHFTCTDA